VKRRLGPIVSILLLAGLVAYVYVYEIRGRAGDDASAAAKDKAIPFERATLKSVRLTNESGALRLEKEGDAWKLTEPLKADTDKDAVEGLLNSLELAKVERRLGKAEDRKQYGLDPPKASVTIESSSPVGPRTLLIGESSPIGGSYYALLPGTNEVSVVSSSIGDMTRKEASSLRDKSLLTLDPWKVKRFTLERGRETIRLEKPDDGWLVRQPVEAPADGPTITDLLNALETLRATRFDSEKPSEPDLKRFGLSPPQARLTILQEGWDVEKSVVFGKEAPGGGRYARTLGRDPVLTVPADFWTKVTTRLFDLRRHDLLGVQQYRVEAITLARNRQPAITLARDKDQTWILSGAARGKLKADSVDLLMRMISDLKVVAFDDSPKETVRAGIVKRPALDLTLQEEADASSGKQKSQHLLISEPDKAGHVLVRDMAWRPIAVAAADVLKKIDGQIDALLKEAAEAPKPEASPAGSAAPSSSPGTVPR
jgi:uncharacterized protein DUF4340